MANEHHISLLRQGDVMLVWNKWRAQNKDTIPDLTGADLSGVDLDGADLSTTNLEGANLSGAHLGAELGMANLRDATLHGANLTEASLVLANLSGADLRETILREADLESADLSGANLREADFSGASLSGVDLSGADLRDANLKETKVNSVRWDRSRMQGRYLGIRGIGSCFGNALFKRSAADQDFLDTLEDLWANDQRILLFRLWGWLDYGRSMARVAVFGFSVTSLFAGIFYIWPTLLDYGQSAHTWFTPYYYSVVTFTTLGFGDVRPAGWVGEILAALEVIIGYITLGLLLAVLAEKLARRS